MIEAMAGMTLIDTEPQLGGRDLTGTVRGGQLRVAGAPLGLPVRVTDGGRIELPAEYSGSVLARALAAHPAVEQVAVVHPDGRRCAVVVPARYGAARRSARVGRLLDRVNRLAPQRVLQIGIGEADLPAALSAQCADYRLVDPSVPRVCDVLARRPDLRLRSRVHAMPPTADVLAAPEPYDLVLLDLAAPSLSTVDAPGSAVDALRLVTRAGAVVVANLRDPRLERLASWLRTGTAMSTPDAAGWSPPALVRALAAAPAPAAPGVAVHSYPPLDLTGEFDVVLRHAGAAPRAPVLRWNRDLRSTSDLAGLLADRRVERVRLVAIPLAGVVEAVAAWRAATSANGRALGTGVDWRDLAATGIEHGYQVTFAAPLTGLEYHVDAVVERNGTRPVDSLAGRLRRWLAAHPLLDAGPVDLVMVDTG